MDDLTAFREDVAKWFAENAPQDWRGRAAELDAEQWEAFQRAWLATLNTRGFAAPHVPTEWGGAGLSTREQAVLFEEWARADAPSIDMFGISTIHLPSTLLRAGSPEQQAAYVRQAINGVIWCQGFSEPEAGSDLVSLRTSARRDGDDYVISGQKIWSSQAANAKHCLLLARTDPDAAPRAGITYFIVDMDSPGIEVRPIRQSTGHDEFCEIFLDAVRVPAANVIGRPGDGWRIAQTTLETERSVLAYAEIARLAHALNRVVTDARARAPELFRANENEIATLMGRQAALEQLAMTTLDAIDGDRRQAGIASVLKVAFSELLRDVFDLAVRLGGAASLVMPPSPRFTGFITGDWTLDWLTSFGWLIAGGTNEIQRNIIAEQVLELPREPRPHGSRS
jgi:alkylation response protein AidB-like acyl-CoA dehydrogenase